ncbi:MAG: hypothetical protein AAGD32_02970 [Planctomycetota bacterium]
MNLKLLPSVAVLGALILFVSLGAQEQQRPNMGQMLVDGLKSTPGCLDADAANLSSGKACIFAWFENKEAALAWYHHPVHVRMRAAIPTPDVGEEDREPMANVPDDVPVLAVATMIFDGEPLVKDSPVPFSGISIELYTPLDAGLRANGGFAPSGFIPGHED